MLGNDFVEAKNDEYVKDAGTFLRDSEVQEITKESTEGAHVLDPQPSDDPADPLNWSWGWKHWILFQVSFASLMGPYSAAGIIPGFDAMAAEFHHSVNSISYQVGINILGLTWGNIFWTPLSNSYGRRPVYVLAMLISLAGNAGGSRAPTYRALMAARFFQALGGSAPNCNGASTIADVFFLHERGAKTGLWTYPSTIGPYIGPLVGGFLIQAKGWRWAMYLMTIINGVQFLLMLFTLPETLYVRKPDKSTYSPEKAREHPILYNLMRPFWRRIGRKLTCMDFVRPFQMLRYPNVAAIVIPYTIGVAYADVGLTNLIPQTFGPLYGFDAAQQGLSFIGFLIGCLIGELLSGRLSDIIVAQRTKKNGGVFVPEMRLAMLPVGFVLLPIGLFLWGLFVDLKTPWIGPVVAGGIAICGLQIIITIGTVYLIDAYKPQASISSTTLFFCRQIFGFTIPFYNFTTAERIGYAPWFGVQTALTLLSFIPALFLVKYGTSWRAKYGKPTFNVEL